MLQAPPEGNPPPPTVEIPVPPPTTTTGALTEKEKLQKAVNSNDFMIWSLVLVGVCLLGAVVFYFLERWRKRGATGTDSREDSLSLSNFREMYEAGEITEAEYRKVRDKLAAQMKTKLGLPGKPSTSSALKPVLPPDTETGTVDPPKPPEAN
jgi:hypothetical protein